MLSTSGNKKTDAARLGAKDFAVTKNKDIFTRLAEHFDLILNTVSAVVDYNAFVGLLKPNMASFRISR
jgi:alcohol dehydrogenase (NADP+)